MGFLASLRRLEPHLLLLRPPSASPPFYHLATSVSRLLSAIASPQAPLLTPNTQFVDYLIQSCGLPSDDAVRASKHIRHLKSPVKPDSVLHFLREIGIRESVIRIAVSRDARVLLSTLEKNWIPNVAKLQEVGLSIEDISVIISRSPGVFLFNFAPKVDFWRRTLGSVENLSVVLKRNARLLNSNFERVVVPNLSFLQEQCGFSHSQIARLIKLAPRLVSSSAENLKMRAQRAEELGFARSSGMFVYGLTIIYRLSQHTLDARLNNLKSLGFSQEEVNLMVSKAPLLLGIREELVGCKMEFLIKEAGCDKIDVVGNPTLLNYSLEKRLIPRSFVRKLLMSKGLSVANNKFASFVSTTEKRFVEMFVLPYEHAVPGLHQAYADASVGKFGIIE